MSAATRDISTSEDIRQLVDEFYNKLVIDPVVGHFFVGLDLAHHLPRISAFWEMVLLEKPGYTTNVTDVHIALSKRIPMERAHFDRWLELFRATIDDHFAGTNAEEAKLRALSIAMVIGIKTQAS